MFVKNINKQLISDDDEDEASDLIIHNDDFWVVNNDKSFKKIEKIEKINDNYSKKINQNKLQKIFISGQNDNQNNIKDLQTPKFNENFINSAKINKNNDTNNNNIKIVLFPDKSLHNEKVEKIKDKTNFSKIAEDLYIFNMQSLKYGNKDLNFSKEEEDNYNKLTMEKYLFCCARKENSKNSKIISDFIERKSKEQLCKKIGIELQKDSKDKNNYKRLSCQHKQVKQYKKIRSPEQFLNDQKNWEEKHNNLINNMIKMRNDEIKLSIQDRPSITKKGQKLVKMNKKINKNVFLDLYEDFNIKRKNQEEKYNRNHSVNNDLSFSRIKKLDNNTIKANSNRLYKEYLTKKNKINENEIKQLNNIKNLSDKSLIGKKSNNIISKKLLNIYKNTLKSVFDKNISDSFKISFHDYLFFIFKLGLINKNYNELNEVTDSHKDESFLAKENKNPNVKSMEKKYYENEQEYKLAKDSWKIITNKKAFNEENLGSSKRVLLFFLIICGICKGDVNFSFLKKEFPFLLEEDKTNLNEINISKQIYKYFYLFRNSILNISIPNIKENKKNVIINNNDSINKLNMGSKSFIKPNFHLKKKLNKIINNKNTIVNKKELNFSKTIKVNNSLKCVKKKLKMNTTFGEINKINNNIHINFDNNKKNKEEKTKKKIINRDKNSFTIRSMYNSKFGKTEKIQNKSNEIENKISNTLIKKISNIKILNTNKSKNILKSNLFEKKNSNCCRQKFLNIKEFNTFVEPRRNKEEKIQQNNDFQQHDTKKESSMNNYILNENYRIEENIKTNGNSNNFIEGSSVKKPTKDILDEYYYYNLKSIKSSDSKNIIISNQYSNNEKKITKNRNGNNPTGAKKKKNRFVFKIKMKDEMIRLVIFRGENIEMKLNEFCHENNIDQDDKQQIFEVIKIKLNE